MYHINLSVRTTRPHKVISHRALQTYHVLHPVPRRLLLGRPTRRRVFRIGRCHSLFTAFVSIKFVNITLRMSNSVTAQLFAIEAEFRPLLTGRVVGSLTLRQVRQFRVGKLANIVRFVGNVGYGIAGALALALRRPIGVGGRVQTFTNLLLGDGPNGLLRDVSRFAVTAGRVLSVHVIVDSSLRRQAAITGARLSVTFMVNSIRWTFRMINNSIDFFVRLVSHHNLLLHRVAAPLDRCCFRDMGGKGLAIG